MKNIKLQDVIYNELYILTKKEWEAIGSDWKINTNGMRGAFLPGYGTTLFYEYKHFLVNDEKKPLISYTVWHNHKIIGYCKLTEETRDEANENSGVFYFGIDRRQK